MRNVLIAAAAVLLLAGCSSTWSSSSVTPAPGLEITPVSESDSAPINPKAEAERNAEALKIMVTEDDVTDKPYETLAELEVTINKTTLFHPDPTRELVREKLREEAQKIDADAVILVRYGTVGVSFSVGVHWMVGAVRLNSRIRHGIIVLSLATVLAACSRAAPRLPPDYGSERPEKSLTAENFSLAELKLSCSDIKTEFSTLMLKEKTNESVIRGERAGNQAAGYIAGVLFLPAIFLAKENEKEKKQLDEIQRRRDTLIALERFKKC